VRLSYDFICRGEVSNLEHSTYVGGLGDYDQGTHLLIGEDKFRGRHRCKFFYHACAGTDGHVMVAQSLQS
jgi:hypothetical protein